MRSTHHLHPRAHCIMHMKYGVTHSASNRALCILCTRSRDSIPLMAFGQPRSIVESKSFERSCVSRDAQRQTKEDTFEAADVSKTTGSRLLPVFIIQQCHTRRGLVYLSTPNVWVALSLYRCKTCCRLETPDLTAIRASLLGLSASSCILYESSADELYCTFMISSVRCSFLLTSQSRRPILVASRNRGTRPFSCQQVSEN